MATVTIAPTNLPHLNGFSFYTQFSLNFFVVVLAIVTGPFEDEMKAIRHIKIALN